MTDTATSQTYLITGGAGFIGSHLTDVLLANNQRVLSIDNLSTGRMQNIAQHLDNPNFHFARASILDDLVLDRLASQANVIIHLAAAVGVQLIVDRPVHTIETNVGGTEKVLKAALRYGCRTILASTSEVYGKGIKVPFSEEDDVLLGTTSKSRWSYAASKMVDEFLGLAYHAEYGLDVIVVRFFNTVGPRQTGQYGMVIPRFARQVLNNEPITVYGSGEQSRCFCNVQDVVRALVKLVEHPSSPGYVYNIGGNEEISIANLAKRMRALANSQSKIVQVPYDQAYGPGFEDMQRRVPNTTRMLELTGWQPQISLDETLQQVIDFERRER
ncbi:MAG: NAD-dependent epimerase/dehydratase family protein [Candidatus Promineifilaceae bacterium]